MEYLEDIQVRQNRMISYRDEIYRQSFGEVELGIDI